MTVCVTSCNCTWALKQISNKNRTLRLTVNAVLSAALQKGEKIWADDNRYLNLKRLIILFIFQGSCVQNWHPVMSPGMHPETHEIQLHPEYLINCWTIVITTDQFIHGLTMGDIAKFSVLLVKTLFQSFFIKGQWSYSNFH